uniref:Ycf41 n=1 Tax=Pterocladia lucida TaxID=31408 RepID=A0A6M3WVY4_PTELU|nr:Ycf41 [Pterocladia lucida]
MNLCMFTGKIVNQSEIIIINNRSYLYTILMLPNNKRGQNFYKVMIIAMDEVAKDMFELYQVGDSIIVESSIYMKQYKKSLARKTSKLILFQVHDLHPTSNILNNFV